MVTIESQNAIATFSPTKGNVWEGKMYIKDTQVSLDLGYALAEHFDEWLAVWNRIFSCEQLNAHPILKEWGCKRDDCCAVLSK